MPKSEVDGAAEPVVGRMASSSPAMCSSPPPGRASRRTSCPPRPHAPCDMPPRGRRDRCRPTGGTGSGRDDPTRPAVEHGGNRLPEQVFRLPRGELPPDLKYFPIPSVRVWIWQGPRRFNHESAVIASPPPENQPRPARTDRLFSWITGHVKQQLSRRLHLKSYGRQPPCLATERPRTLVP